MEKVDNVNGIITVSLAENDYQDKVKKELKLIGQRYPEKGFRPGHVPTALLQKKYGKEALVEVVNREVYDALMKHIQDNKLNILGEPLLANANEIDFNADKDFTFKFEIGFGPEFNIAIDKNITIPYYNIKVDDEMVKKQDEALCKRFGKQVPGEEVDATALVKGSLVELNEDGSAKEDGISVESTVVSPQYFRNEEQKALFMGKKVGDEVVFNPSATCDGNTSELASMLNVDKDKANVASDFKMTIKEIIVVKNAEHNQEFFDGVFGKDVVTTEKGYVEKIKEMIATQLKNDSNYRFTIDTENVLREKAGSIELPEEFLKKWLLKQDKEGKRSPETIDDDFAKMRSDLEWQLIKEHAVKELGVKVEDADLLAVASMVAQQQFAQYGMMNMPEDVVKKYAKEILDNEDYRQRIIERAVEDKMYNGIKEAVNVEEKDVTSAEFNALFASK